MDQRAIHLDGDDKVTFSLAAARENMAEMMYGAEEEAGAGKGTAAEEESLSEVVEVGEG